MSDHICHVCGKSYSSSQVLRRHLRDVHKLQAAPESDNKFICDLCGESFASTFSVKRHKATKHKKDDIEADLDFPCTTCTSSFKSRKVLYAHQRDEHDQVEVDETVQVCHFCDKQFSGTFSLKRHQHDQHGIGGAEEGKLQCPLCKELLLNSVSVEKHLSSTHKVDLDIELLDFDCKNDFFNWKEDMEEETLSHYVQTSGAKKVKEGLRTYFNCHRSGTGRGKQDPKRIRWKGSSKLNIHCPAFITVTENEIGAIEVKFCKTHVGHSQSLGCMHLTKAARASLALKIEQDVPLDVILKQVRDGALREPCLKRIHLLEKRDLLNIIKEFQLKNDFPHFNDATSIDLWVKNHSESSENIVVFYKPQGVVVPNCALEKEDFMLVLMTKYQEEVLTEFVQKKILIDSTHGLTNYDFQLTTVMTVDDYAAGCPFAFCLSNRIDFKAMTELFTAIKGRVGIIDSSIFMSDDCPSYYNAWESVMSPVPHRLLCTWHVDKNWREQAKQKIKNKAKTVQVYKGCRTLLEHLEADELPEMIEGFLIMCENDEETKAFGEYFRDHYANRVKMWSWAHRLCLGLNTNMYLEALHKKIKYCYFDGRKNRRVDKCVAALLLLMRDLIFERIIRHIKNKPTHRMLKITASHQKSLTITIEMISATGKDTWTVLSSAPTRGPYHVEMRTSSCSGCPLACPICHVCIHTVSCTCTNYLLELNICKHIHACMRGRLQSQAECPAEFQGQKEYSILQSGASSISMKAGVDQQSQLNASLELIMSLHQKLKPESIPKALVGAEKYIKSLQKLVREQADDTSTTLDLQLEIPESFEEKAYTPANKKISPQRQFHSTKKRDRRLDSYTVQKPGDMQKLVLQQMFKSEAARTCEVINIASQPVCDHQY